MAENKFMQQALLEAGRMDLIKNSRKLQALEVLVNFNAPLGDIEKGLELENGQTPLILAAQFGRVDELKYLIAHQADVNSKDEFGKTALDWAM